MKWNRQELKQMARTALRGSYWKSVLAAFLLAIASTAFASSGWRVSANEMSDYSGSYYSNLPMIAVLVLFGGCLGIALVAFVLRPLEVGCRRFFLEDIYYPADLAALKAGFAGNYLNVVWIMFCRDLFIVLWSLLFIVPGIVKSYEYKMIPYLLAENPDMSREEAFALSRQMMYGEKMDTFVLEMSFIGWAILSAITMGMVGIFYYQPYLALTEAALYQALCWKMENNGVWEYRDDGYAADGYAAGDYGDGGFHAGPDDNAYGNGGFHAGPDDNAYGDSGYDNYSGS